MVVSGCSGNIFSLVFSTGGRPPPNFGKNAQDGLALKTRRPNVLGLSPLCWSSRSSVGFFDEAISRIHSTNSITHHPGHNGSQFLAVGHGYADNPTRHRLHCLDRNWINWSIYRWHYNAGRADQRNKDLCGRTHCVRPDLAEAIKSLTL